MRRLICISLLFLAGCASQQDLELLNGRVNELVTTVKKQETTLDDQSRLLKQTMSQQAETQAMYNELMAENQALLGRIDELASNRGNDVRLQALEKELRALKETASAAPVAPKSPFEQGQEYYRSKRYNEAAQSFEAYLAASPDGAQAADAHYYIGEALLATGRNEDAILKFDRVIKKYPKSDKYPMCLLRQGQAFISLGDKETGRIILQRLVKEAPGSEAASKAKGLLGAN